MYVAICIAGGLNPNGDRYIHVGSLRGRALSAASEL